jgi:hypothetical protein
MKSPDPRHSASRLGAESSQFLPSIQASSDALPVGYPRMPRLLVHGGAWAIPASEEAAHEAGVRRALEAGYAVLERGGPALDAVVAAVMVLEDDETFDAGRGSFLTADGRVQLDALLMDGGRMKAGGGGVRGAAAESDQGGEAGARRESACVFCGRRGGAGLRRRMGWS